MDFKGIWVKVMDRINLVQDAVKWRASVGTVIKLRILLGAWNFLNGVSRKSMLYTGVV
jgi:hypothetical protein